MKDENNMSIWKNAVGLVELKKNEGKRKKEDDIAISCQKCCPSFLGFTSVSPSRARPPPVLTARASIWQRYRKRFQNQDNMLKLSRNPVQSGRHGAIPEQVFKIWRLRTYGKKLQQ